MVLPQATILAIRSKYAEDIDRDVQTIRDEYAERLEKARVDLDTEMNHTIKRMLDNRRAAADKEIRELEEEKVKEDMMYRVKEGSTSSGSMLLKDIVAGVEELVPDRLIDAFNDAPDYTVEQMYAFDEIIDWLEEIAPDGMVFGTQEGDGACYGWWKVEEEKEWEE